MNDQNTANTQLDSERGVRRIEEINKENLADINTLRQAVSGYRAERDRLAEANKVLESENKRLEARVAELEAKFGKEAQGHDAAVATAVEGRKQISEKVKEALTPRNVAAAAAVLVALLVAYGLTYYPASQNKPALAFNCDTKDAVVAEGPQVGFRIGSASKY